MQNECSRYYDALLFDSKLYLVNTLIDVFFDFTSSFLKRDEKQPENSEKNASKIVDILVLDIFCIILKSSRNTTRAFRHVSFSKYNDYLSLFFKFKIIYDLLYITPRRST